MKSPHQRELQRITVGLLSMTEAQRRVAMTQLDTEECAYVAQLSAEASRACRTLAAISGWSYDQAVAVVADMQERSNNIAVFLELGIQRPGRT